MSEKISQLIDQELNSNQRDVLLEQISNNEVARKTWQRYHLIGSVIRGEVSDTGRDLAANISNSLEKEPTVLAPLLVDASSSMAKTDIWKSVGIFATAASLVLVAVVTLNPLDVLNKNNADLTNNRLADTSNTNQFRQQFPREFNEMLTSHAEFTASPGMSGLIVYAKLVSAENTSNAQP